MCSKLLACGSDLQAAWLCACFAGFLQPHSVASSGMCFSVVVAVLFAEAWFWCFASFLVALLLSLLGSAATLCCCCFVFVVAADGLFVVLTVVFFLLLLCVLAWVAGLCAFCFLFRWLNVVWFLPFGNKYILFTKKKKMLKARILIR